MCVREAGWLEGGKVPLPPLHSGSAKGRSDVIDASPQANLFLYYM